MNLLTRLRAAIRGAVSGWREGGDTVVEHVEVVNPIDLTPDHVKERVAALTNQQRTQAQDLGLEIRLIRDRVHRR